MKPTSIFMTCEWKDLIMASFEVDKSILEPYLPYETELDLYKGKAVLSLVAFTFSKVKFFGLKIPFHQKFAQINFRIYVKSKKDGSRGVVFIKEYAPKHLIALVGNKIYKEPYFFKPICLKKTKKGAHIELQYSHKGAIISANARLNTDELQKNTLKHFIVDRYIAYIKNKKHKTVRYNIYHKPWESYQMDKSYLNKDLLKLLPPNFKNLKYLSTYLVNGSEVNVQTGVI